MKLMTRSQFVSIGLIAAAIAISLLPLPGQTQDSPDAPPKPPTAPSDPFAPPKLGEKTDTAAPTAADIKALVDQIRKEVAESVRRELQIKVMPRPRIIHSDRIESEDRNDKVIAEQIERAREQAERAEELAVIAGERTKESEARWNAARDMKMQNVRVHLFGDRRGPPFTFKSSSSDQQFEHRTREFLATYDQYNDSTRNEFIEKATKLVAEHFDFKQTVRENELKQLEAQLKKLQSLHQQRVKEKNEIIRDRVRQLTREAAGLGWGSNKTGANSGTELDEENSVEEVDDIKR